MDLAMIELTGTRTFTNFLAIEKNRINATIAAEVNTIQIENGVTHIPAGVPCN